MWELLEDDKITIFEEDGTFFLRASISHFSQVCLGKSAEYSSGYDVQTMTGPYRPWRKEIEFVNATKRNLYFLVLPTTISVSFWTKLAAGLGIQGVSANLTTERRKKEYILKHATQPQFITVLRNKNTGEEPPKAGVMCESSTVQLLNCSGNEAVVVLMTVTGSEDDRTLEVWDSRIIKHRTRVTIFQDLFSSEAIPTLGRHILPKIQSIAEAGSAVMKRLEHPETHT